MNNTNIVEQAKQALPILQAIVEQSPRVKLINYSKPSACLTDFLCRYQLKELEFPEPPKGEEWHNPENFSAEKVEVDKGWRLLLKSELLEKFNAKHITNVDCDCECFIEPHLGKRAQWFSGYHGALPDKTYRTKTPLPEPAQEMTVADIEKLLGKKIKIVKG